MLKGDCNNCLHVNEPEDSEVCIECGIARKNYEEKIMTEYISREALPEKKERGFFSDDEFNAGWNACLDVIASTPATDVAEVRQGRWIADKEDVEWGNHLIYYRCSECKEQPHFDKDKYEFILSPYCPNCGAKMDGEDNGTT